MTTNSESGLHAHLRERTREWQVSLLHSVRTAIAALVSLWIAQLFRLPEAYWACITTLIVMQSSFVESWTGSWQRLLGTALGAAMGALLTRYSGSSALAFGIGVFAMGLICALLRIKDAYRLANITLAIVVLIRRAEPAWIIAGHRFLEVAIGIAVALLLSAVWPEKSSSRRTATA